MTKGIGFLGSFLAFICFSLLFAISCQPKILSLMRVSLIFGIFFEGGFFIWLFIKKQHHFPLSGLEIPIIVFLTCTLVSLAFSPSPLNGIERVAWFVTYIIWFYLLLHCHHIQKFSTAIRNGLLLVSGILLLQVILETYTWYLGWWAMVDSRTIMPPFTYRYKGFFGSNYFMAFVNLCAPLCVTAFVKVKRLTSRYFFALWLVLYIIAVPFSSSRGGWLGSAAWIGSITLLWLFEKTRLNNIIDKIKRNWTRYVFCFVISIAILSISGIWFYSAFAGSNPTHGSGIGLNREQIWGGALTLWKNSPLIGKGPGLVSQSYLDVTSSFPSGWWPKNAHSVPLQILAEFGTVGFIAFAFLMVNTVIALYRAYKTSMKQDKHWKIASLASLASIFAHGSFDDFTWLPVIMALSLFHLSSVLSNRSTNRFFQPIPVVSLLVPALITSLAGVYSLWAYTPLIDAISISNSDWFKAALKAEESVRRNPSLPFYRFHAGIAWSMNWQQNEDPSALIQAIDRFNEVINMEPSNSVAWANLAVLNWHAGNKQEALEYIQKAIRISPKESSFHLNYGWFLEQSGQDRLALCQYQKVIDLAPWTIDHPFWQRTAVRKLTLSTYPRKEYPIPYWKQAANELQNGDIAAYKKSLLLSEIYREPAAAMLASATASTISPDREVDENTLEKLFWSIQSRYGYFYGKGYLYGSAYNKYGFDRMVVPGYLMVSENDLQFAGLEKLYEVQNSNGECEQALITWEVLQRELHAGELIEAGLPPSPFCAPVMLENSSAK